LWRGSTTTREKREEIKVEEMGRGRLEVEGAWCERMGRSCSCVGEW
jgi:hypothetical protein